jgi:hypothetical protein
MVSYSLSPSVNQRGTRLFESWIAKTCASSCQMTLPQLKGCARGLIAASVRPKHTPWIPAWGRPFVRTAKFSFVA